ncbi:hypothetical protein BJP40_19190 [Streptomyces sp. CC53]|nr:hypothetical protein BJP40_19190 [Streptomyces sp. CC53]
MTGHRFLTAVSQLGDSRPLQILITALTSQKDGLRQRPGSLLAGVNDQTPSRWMWVSARSSSPRSWESRTKRREDGP